MSKNVGFILLTHNKPAQIRRLIDRLDRMFEQPPIVCHHDFSQCELAVERFSKNVSFVRPHLPTKWAEFSVVEATVRAIRQICESPDNPDWVVLLSGSDYPIASSAQIRRDLEVSPYDAHIQSIPIQWGNFEEEWQRVCYKRYCAKQVHYPSMTRRLMPTRRTIVLEHPSLTRPFVPFSAQFRCYAGSQWFCVRRRAAEYIADFHMNRPALAAHYRKVDFSEESYFQSILANAPQFHLSDNNFRYTDWSANGAHPKTLSTEDLPQLLSSSKHFARKFDIDLDSKIMDSIDAIIDAA